MSKLNSLSEVRRNPTINRYLPVCKSFIEYLWEKERIILIIDGFDDKGDWIDIEKPYIHRWKSDYLKARLAKLYLLDKWAQMNPSPLSMLTFTTYHDSMYAKRMTGKKFTIEKSWNILKIGFRKTSLLIRNKIRKGTPYFWIVEPQPESGYPHIHAGYFTKFNEFEQHRLKNHWSEIVKAGDYNHGLDFSFNQEYQNGEITSLRNYVMKYLAKTFIDTISQWSPQELIFNSIAWKYRYRLFGCSRDLSKAMQNPNKKDLDFTWVCTTLHRPDHGHEEDRIIHKVPNWVPANRKVFELYDEIEF